MPFTSKQARTMFEIRGADEAGMRAEFEKPNREADTLVIVFASAGLAFGGAPVQEFRKTFEQVDPGFTYDVCWVFDTLGNWFGTMDRSPEFAPFIERVEQYSRCMTIGESKGGLGALQFRQFVSNWDRALALGPQYSVSSPFIAFDTALRLSREIPVEDISLAIPTRATPEELRRIAILFGADVWADFIHASFYRLAGYRPRFVSGAQHSVAARLKPLGLLPAMLTEFLAHESGVPPFSSIAHLLQDEPSNKVLELDVRSRLKPSS
jgi:hypothetical protein